MSNEWLAAIGQALVSEVQLAAGWHTIDVPSFTVSPETPPSPSIRLWPTPIRRHGPESLWGH